MGWQMLATPTMNIMAEMAVAIIMPQMVHV
jgi:hypothetical protein